MRAPKILPILLGSGVSCAGGLPAVNDLSAKVIDSVTKKHEKLALTAIREACGLVHGADRHNYEDWYYVATQVWQHILREYENPAIERFVADLSAIVGFSENETAEICEGLAKKIVRVIVEALATSKASPEDAFGGLSKVIGNNVQTTFRIFTLNHDLLLERYLQQHEIDAYLGFEPHKGHAQGAVFSFSRDRFSKCRVSLLKLHGSINWWRHRYTRARKRNNPWPDEFIGVRLKSAVGIEQMDDTPLILAGTFNKILQYSSAVFLQLLAEFQYTLLCADRLVVCGYGFGDKGINSLLASWMSANTKRSLFVVGPHPFDPDRCRGAIAGKVDMWSNEDRLHVVAKRVGPGPADVDWNKILIDPLKT
jgi:hypothetical protein